MPPPQPQHMSFEVKSSSSQQPHADGHVMVYPQGSPSSSIASPFVLVQLPEYVPPNVRSQVFSVGPWVGTYDEDTVGGDVATRPTSAVGAYVGDAVGGDVASSLAVSRRPAPSSVSSV